MEDERPVKNPVKPETEPPTYLMDENKMKRNQLSFSFEERERDETYPA